MRRWPLLCGALAWCVVGLVACSPALNWRAVQLHGLSAMLPCKPDRAQRTVQLGAAEVGLEMAGCEAGGALYAISHTRVESALRADAARAAWRQQTLATMRAAAVQEAPLRMLSADDLMRTAQRITAQGQRPDGSAVNAQLLWLTSGADLYHVAVYADPLTDEMTEMLFSGLRLQ